MLTLIDNYDSFTFNLVQFLGDLGATCRVIRNDAASIEEVLGDVPQALILSPGPCDPDRAGMCVELVKAAPPELPIFGVCLGHQCIAQAYGAKIIHADKIMHGKLSRIKHDKTGLFAGLEDCNVTRYHSLVVEATTLPACLHITARTDDGVIMGIKHETRPIYGVQFHPESIASQGGHRLLANFLQIAGIESKEIKTDQHLVLN